MHQYGQELEAHWKPLMEQAETLTHQEFGELFIEYVTEFVQERPAYLKLIAAPIKFSRDAAARRGLRMAIANAFRAKTPSLTAERALLAANVAVQMVRSMTTLY